MQHQENTNLPWLYRMWLQCRRWPLGSRLFSWAMNRKIPYSGNLHAHVCELSPGHCLLQIRERKALRNHLHSLHALALANAGELCSGLALHTLLPNHQRGIVLEICSRYLHKARGKLLAQGRVLDPLPETEGEIRVQGELRNEAGDIVSVTEVRWKIGLKPQSTV